MAGGWVADSHERQAVNIVRKDSAMDIVSLRGESVCTIASARLRVMGCPSTRKVWKNPVRRRNACSGRIE